MSKAGQTSRSTPETGIDDINIDSIASKLDALQLSSEQERLVEEIEAFPPSDTPVHEEDGYYFGNIVVIRHNRIGSNRKPVGKKFREYGSSIVQPMLINWNTIEEVQFDKKKPRPKCVLVVEKLCAFNDLLSFGLYEFPCLMVTGMGQPSQECRFFLKKVLSDLNIPIFGFFDMNPSGFDIFKTYKYGSFSLAFQTDNLVVPMTAIGFFESDVKYFDLDVKGKMQGLGDRDRQLLPTQKSSSWVKKEPKIKESLDYMSDKEKKADMELIPSLTSYEIWLDFLRIKMNEALDGQPEG